MFSLICVWINDWVNNREAGDYLRRYRAHHDVIVMHKLIRRQLAYSVLFIFSCLYLKYSSFVIVCNWDTQIPVRAKIMLSGNQCKRCKSPVLSYIPCQGDHLNDDTYAIWFSYFVCFHEMFGRISTITIIPLILSIHMYTNVATKSGKTNLTSRNQNNNRNKNQLYFLKRRSENLFLSYR